MIVRTPSSFDAVWHDAYNAVCLPTHAERAPNGTALMDSVETFHACDRWPEILIVLGELLAHGHRVYPLTEDGIHLRWLPWASAPEMRTDGAIRIRGSRTPVPRHIVSFPVRYTRSGTADLVLLRASAFALRGLAERAGWHRVGILHPDTQTPLALLEAQMRPALGHDDRYEVLTWP